VRQSHTGSGAAPHRGEAAAKGPRQPLPAPPSPAAAAAGKSRSGGRPCISRASGRHDRSCEVEAASHMGRPGTAVRATPLLHGREGKLHGL